MPQIPNRPDDQYPTRGESINFFLGALIGSTVGLALGGFIGAVIFHGC